MNKQTKPSELEVAARDALRYLQSLGVTDPQRSILMKPLREALENHKPAPLPDAVVELIEHCSDATDRHVDLDEWLTDARNLAINARAHLPVELKPCPFCGGDAHKNESYTAGCVNTDCAIYGIYSDIDKWQKRGEPQ